MHHQLSQFTAVRWGGGRRRSVAKRRGKSCKRGSGDSNPISGLSSGYPVVIQWLSSGYPVVIQWLSSGYPGKKGLTADPRTVPVVSPQTDAMPCLKCPRSLQKWLAIPGLPSRFPVALRAAPFVPTCGKATKGRLGWVKQLDGSPERDVKDRMGRDSFFLIFLPRILGQVT